MKEAMNALARFVVRLFVARRLPIEVAAKYYGVSAVEDTSDQQTSARELRQRDVTRFTDLVKQAGERLANKAEEASSAEPTQMAAQIEVLQREVGRLKKQIRAERIADRGGRPPKDAIKLSALPIGDATHRDLGSGDGFTLGIVGESYRQGTLRRVVVAREIL